MNPEQLLAHLKRLTSTLTTRQLVSLGAAFVGAVALTVGSAYWINTPSYALLFSDMDAESAAAVTTKLKADKVPYLLEDNGRTLRVPSERVDDLRLEFSAQGMPGAGRIGFEIFDRTAFGTTEFLEKVNYRRAMEGELARTIATIADVSSARVHISLAKDSLFQNEAQPAKASVVLKLRDRKPLAPGTVAGITGLVAGAVESLRPESVVILDTFGRSLTRQASDTDDPGSGIQFDAQRRVERDLTAKVVALLEPVVGEGRARVNVTALLDGNSEEVTEEKWDPSNVVRTKQTSTDSAGSGTAAGSLGAGVQGGVAGARANAPPNTSTAPTTPTQIATTPATSTRSTEATQYEISKTVTHRIAPRGQIKRLAVAVVVDDQRSPANLANGQPTSRPRDAAELQRLQHLIATSVGIDMDRGDEVTVENIAFGDDGMEVPAAPQSLMQRLTPMVKSGGAIFEVGRVVAILGIALMAFLMILRPMARNALTLPPALEPVTPLLAAGQSARSVADLESQIEADLDGTSGRIPMRLGALTKRLTKTVEKEPEHVARLVRSLLSEEDR